MKTYIYALVDPTDNAVQYVGKSIKPSARFLQHLYERGPSLKCRWVKQLREKELEPILVVLDITTNDSAAQRLEQLWIGVLIVWGEPLLNIATPSDIMTVLGKWLVRAGNLPGRGREYR